MPCLFLAKVAFCQPANPDEKVCQALFTRINTQNFYPRCEQNVFGWLIGDCHGSLGRSYFQSLESAARQGYPSQAWTWLAAITVRLPALLGPCNTWGSPLPAVCDDEVLCRGYSATALPPLERLTLSPMSERSDSIELFLPPCLKLLSPGDVDYKKQIILRKYSRWETSQSNSLSSHGIQWVHWGSAEHSLPPGTSSRERRWALPKPWSASFTRHSSNQVYESWWPRMHVQLPPKKRQCVSLLVNSTIDGLS